MHGTSMRIEEEAGASGDVVRLGGELDLTNTPELEQALARTASQVVVLDLSELAFVDSAGMRAIDQAHRQLAESDRTLLIVAPAESRAAWTFRVAGFSDDLLHESLDEALLEAVRGARP